MRRRTQVLTTVSCALVVVASLVAVAGGDVASTSAKRGFTPGKIGGKWTGAWRNLTFGSTGSIRANVRVKKRKMVVLADFGGLVFGCEDPPATAPVTLRRGKGKNSWNAKGFRLSATTKAFGKLSLNYNFRKKTIRGKGAAPPCNPSISYTVKGKLTPSRFNATVNIDLGGQKATSKLSAKKR
jgi:hypothetical protein